MMEKKNVARRSGSISREEPVVIVEKSDAGSSNEGSDIADPPVVVERRKSKKIRRKRLSSRHITTNETEAIEIKSNRRSKTERAILKVVKKSTQPGYSEDRKSSKAELDRKSRKSRSDKNRSSDKLKFSEHPAIKNQEAAPESQVKLDLDLTSDDGLDSPKEYQRRNYAQGNYQVSPILDSLYGKDNTIRSKDNPMLRHDDSSENVGAATYMYMEDTSLVDSSSSWPWSSSAPGYYTENTTALDHSSRTRTDPGANNSKLKKKRCTAKTIFDIFSLSVLVCLYSLFFAGLPVTCVIFGLVGTCEDEPRLTTWLMVFGYSNVIFPYCFFGVQLFGCLCQKEETSPETKENRREMYSRCAVIIFISFLTFSLAWIIVGNFWLFDVWDGIGTTPFKCDKSMFKFMLVLMLFLDVFVAVITCLCLIFGCQWAKVVVIDGWRKAAKNISRHNQYCQIDCDEGCHCTCMC